MELHLWLEEWSRWLWPWVLLHLWETTLFVGLVALAVRLLRLAPARTRYYFWLLAAVKLLFPSLILGWLVSEVPLGLPVFPPPSLEAPIYGSQASESYRPIHEILEPLLLSQPFATQPQLEGVQQHALQHIHLDLAYGFPFPGCSLDEAQPSLGPRRQGGPQDGFRQGNGDTRASALLAGVEPGG